MDDILNKFDSLFTFVDRKSIEFETRNADRHRRGDMFNIFEIMRVESDEVNTHSAIIAALLDPKGSHGCGRSFQEAFIQSLCLFEQDNRFTNAEFESSVETYIGHVTNDSGGRIDILLKTKDGRKAIIIENKIYAGDGKNQLVRYNNYAKRHYSENYIILYLTLFGNEPSDISKGDAMSNGKEYICISYKDFIKSWLEQCIEKAARLPLVRETLVQYYNLILKLTNQFIMDEKMQIELVEKIANDKLYKEMYAISSVQTRVASHIFDNDLRSQIVAIAESYELKLIWGNRTLDIENQGAGDTYWPQRYAHFFISRDNWPVYIGFEFQSNQLGNFIYGIRHISENQLDTEKDLRNYLKDITGMKQNRWWPCYKLFPISNLDNEDAIAKIYDGTIKNEIEKKVKELVGFLEEYFKKKQ